VQTPEGIEFVLSPAGLAVRACAYGIDQFIQWIIIIGLLIATELLGEAAGIWIILLLIFCLDWFYHVICELLFRGQSIGKKVMGIRVVCADGSPISPGASFLRNLVRFVDTYIFFCPIALVCMLVSRGFRRLGDWAAGTLVVYTSHSLAPPLRAGGHSLSGSWFQNMDPVSAPRPLSGEEKQTIMMFARRYPLLGEARADEIARPYVKFLGGAEDSTSPSAFLLGIARRIAGDTPNNRMRSAASS
jgi:uncharacterized RDD family membrane protein YckC